MKTMKLLTAVILVVSLMLTTCVALAQTYQPGTYVGGAQGFGGEVAVEIEVDEESILSVKVTGEGETPEVGGAAVDPLAAQILEAQGAEIDGVAGATMTSTAAREAAAKAIAAAKGEEAAATGLTAETIPRQRKATSAAMSRSA